MDLIALIILTVIAFMLLFGTLFFRNKYRNALMSVAQLIIDKEKLAYQLDKVQLENSKEVNEGFIKFLSDSRQAAFDYIEQVQSVIQNYLTAVENNNQEAAEAFRIELFSYLPESSEAGDQNQG